MRIAALKKVLSGILGLLLLVAGIFFYNVFFNATTGNPIVPELQGRWWAGYYNTSLLGKQWCVVRFVKTEKEGLIMLVISSFGAPDKYSVKRSSLDRNYVTLKMSGKTGLKIEAKQLYYGKRYILGRLLVGRFKDFLKKNRDISIHGNSVSNVQPNDFEIEPIDDEDIILFWNKYVRPEEIITDPKQIISLLGVVID